MNIERWQPMNISPAMFLVTLLSGSLFLIFQSWDWGAVAKVWGPLGVGCGILLLGCWKIFLPWIKKQQDDTKEILLTVVADARQERDMMRQQRELERDKFLQALELQRVQMESGFKDVAKALDRR